MKNHDLVNYLLNHIQSESEEIKDSLSSGGAVNFESYQRLVGFYQGLQRAEQMINEFLKEERDGTSVN
jgi:hypothetical protein